MKKLLAILLCMATLFSLAACGEKEEESSRRKNKEKEKSNLEILPNAPVAGNYEENSYEENTYEEDDYTPDYPTEEEYALLNEYLRICHDLYYYSNSHISAEVTPGEFVSGNDALLYYHNRLQQMEAVDRWLNTAYIQNLDYYSSEIPIDRQTVLSGFSFVEDVVLSYICTRKEDNLGNVQYHSANNSIQQVATWEYSPDGQLNRINYEDTQITPIHYFTDDQRFEIEYDDKGRISCKKYFNIYDAVAFLLVYSYNEADQLVSVEQRYNTTSNFYEFSYDESGRLAQIRWENVFTYTIDYTYDQQGLLIEERLGEWTTYSSIFAPESNFDYLLSENIHAYTYDEKGNLTTGTFTKLHYYSYGENISNSTTDTVSYTLDNQGRVLKEEITYGPTVSHPGQDIETSTPSATCSKTFEYIYGTYCNYTPAA